MFDFGDAQTSNPEPPAGPRLSLSGLYVMDWDRTLYIHCPQTMNPDDAADPDSAGKFWF